MKFARKAMMTLASNIGVGILSLIGAVVISRVLGADGKGVVTLLFLTPSLVALILLGARRSPHSPRLRGRH